MARLFSSTAKPASFISWNFHAIGLEDVNDYSQLDHARSGYRNCNPHSSYRKSPFFIDWLKKPQLKAEPLKNDERVGSNPSLVKTEQGKPKPEPYRTFEHKSQHFKATWNDLNEPLDKISEKSKVAFKFGVLRITNIHRNLSKVSRRVSFKSQGRYAV